MTVAGNSSATASVTYTFPVAGHYKLYVCADAYSVINETNESNNCALWFPVIVN